MMSFYVQTYNWWLLEGLECYKDTQMKAYGFYLTVVQAVV